MTTSLEQILSVDLDAIEAPEGLPQGAYRFEIAGEPRQLQRGDSYAELSFPCTVREALEEQIYTNGKTTEGTRMSYGFWFGTTDETSRGNDKTLNNVKMFMSEKLGMDFDEGESLPNALRRVRGCEFVGVVVHEKNRKDAERTDINIRKTFSIVRWEELQDAAEA